MQTEGPSWVSSGNREKEGGKRHHAVWPSGTCLVPLWESPAEPGPWLIMDKQQEGLQGS